MFLKDEYYDSLPRAYRSKPRVPSRPPARKNPITNTYKKATTMPAYNLPTELEVGVQVQDIGIIVDSFEWETFIGLPGAELTHAIKGRVVLFLDKKLKNDDDESAPYGICIVVDKSVGSSGNHYTVYHQRCFSTLSSAYDYWKTMQKTSRQ